MTRKAKFYLYRNLHTGGYSIKQRGIVCARGDFFVMRNVKFQVSKPGNKRVKDQQSRNVHAYMVADNYNAGANVLWQPSAMQRVTYNPYKNDTFVNAETGAEITEASYAICSNNGKVYVY